MGWKEDATNAGDHYTRNRIRHHLLPLAEREVCEGAVENMGRAADILSDTEDFVQREAAAAYVVCVTKTAPERLVIPVEKFCSSIRFYREGCCFWHLRSWREQKGSFGGAHSRHAVFV